MKSSPIFHELLKFTPLLELSKFQPKLNVESKIPVGLSGNLYSPHTGDLWKFSSMNFWKVYFHIWRLELWSTLIPSQLTCNHMFYVVSTKMRRLESKWYLFEAFYCNTPSIFLKKILVVNNISSEFYFSLRWLIIFTEVFWKSKAYNGIYVICGNELGEN